MNKATSCFLVILLIPLAALAEKPTKLPLLFRGKLTSISFDVKAGETSVWYHFHIMQRHSPFLGESIRLRTDKSVDLGKLNEMNYNKTVTSLLPPDCPLGSTLLVEGVWDRSGNNFKKAIPFSDSNEKSFLKQHAEAISSMKRESIKSRISTKKNTLKINQKRLEMVNGRLKYVAESAEEKQKLIDKKAEIEKEQATIKQELKELEKKSNR